MTQENKTPSECTDAFVQMFVRDMKSCLLVGRSPNSMIRRSYQDRDSIFIMWNAWMAGRKSSDLPGDGSRIARSGKYAGKLVQRVGATKVS